MILLPAIDLRDGKVVRLLHGDYDNMTVYGDNPLQTALSFRDCGAEFLHVVDLDGARSGKAENLKLITTLVEKSGLTLEVGGGIRNMETVRAYLDAGVARVILGTAALTDPHFLREALAAYGERIAVGIDIRGEKVAVSGWTVTSDMDYRDFCTLLQKEGVKTVICTDITKDGALGGTNVALYRTLCGAFEMRFIASGGVSSLSDIKALRALNLYGAILGKALYTGRLDLREALAAAR